MHLRSKLWYNIGVEVQQEGGILNKEEKEIVRDLKHIIDMLEHRDADGRFYHRNFEDEAGVTWDYEASVVTSRGYAFRVLKRPLR